MWREEYPITRRGGVKVWCDLFSCTCKEQHVCVSCLLIWAMLPDSNKMNEWISESKCGLYHPLQEGGAKFRQTRSRRVQPSRPFQFESCPYLLVGGTLDFECKMQNIFSTWQLLHSRLWQREFPTDIKVIFVSWQPTVDINGIHVLRDEIFQDNLHLKNKSS